MLTKPKATIADLYNVPEHGKAELVNGELILERIVLNDAALEAAKRCLRRIRMFLAIGPKVVKVLVWSMIGFPVLLAVHERTVIGWGDYIVPGSLLILAVGCPLVVCGGWIANWQMKRLGVEIEDPRLVGELVDILEKFRVVNDKMDEKSTRIFNALTNNLPRLTSEEAFALVGKRADFLCKLLEKQHNVTAEFCLALMKALPLFGGQRAMTAVQQICKGSCLVVRDPWLLSSKFAKDPRLTEAAMKCLPLLEERLQSLKATQTLGRPSEAPTAHQRELLLRATQPQPSATPDTELLTPVVTLQAQAKPQRIYKSSGVLNEDEPLKLSRSE